MKPCLYSKFKRFFNSPAHFHFKTFLDLISSLKIAEYIWEAKTERQNPYIQLVKISNCHFIINFITYDWQTINFTVTGTNECDQFNSNRIQNEYKIQNQKKNRLFSCKKSIQDLLFIKEGFIDNKKWKILFKVEGEFLFSKKIF